MASKKLNTSELLRRVDAGDSYADIAKDHGISRQAVYNRVKGLRGRTTKVIAAKKYEKVVERSFDAIDQLTAINKRTLRLLDAAEQNEEFSLKCIAEIRNQIRLAMEIQERIYSQQAAQQFMEIIIDALRSASPDVYEKFRKRVNAERTLRDAIRIA